ncbi:Citrate-sodium symport [Klebsiella michiganensis]|uniref:Citrate-sodium symport n=1 Tax=Klebsiella michiganensis TaxID=1134687 RepID=A0A7H4PK49_9ENTR|nr:Citrate-sodium symport [Klebsiella michiganensis]
MNRTILIQGMVRMFVPLVVGTGAAILTGLLVGSLVGYSFYHTFFFIIVPIIGGGIGEGILPLSLAYSAILGQTPDVYVAQLAPAAVVGNIFAIICAGFLARMGTRRPSLSGSGMLIRSHEDNSVFAQNQRAQPTDFQLMGAGLLMICAFFIVGGLLEKVVHIPGPVLMILGRGILQIREGYPGGDGTGGAQLLQVRLRRAGLAADDRPGNAVCSSGKRGRGLLGWLRGGLWLNRHCDGAKRLSYRFSSEYVPGRSGHRHQLPQRAWGDGRRCHSLGIKPNGINAFCPDSHPYWRRVDGDYRHAIVELACVV